MAAYRVADRQAFYDEQERRAMNGEDDIGYQVELFVYDLSRGIAKNMSPTLLGKEIEGIWHTGVVAYGREYFFGYGGIESCRPGGTILGDPDRVEELGESQVPYQLFLEYIFGLGEATYKPGAYDLFKHNCNNFSDEVSQFLCGRGIPKHILQLPDEVLNTPLGEKLSTLVKDLDIKSSGSRKINFANYNNNNLHTFVPGEYGRQQQRQQQQQQQQQARGDSPDLELERLNQAIDQVRQNTLRLEDRRNSINEKVNKLDKKKKEKREKRERKEKKEKKKKKKSRSSCEVQQQEGGGDKGATEASCSRPPLPPSPLPPTPPPKEAAERQEPPPQPPSPPPPTPAASSPPQPRVPEVTITPAKEEEEEEGGGEGGGGGGGGKEEEVQQTAEERSSPQPITAESTDSQPITAQSTDPQPIVDQSTDPPQPATDSPQPTPQAPTDQNTTTDSTQPPTTEEESPPQPQEATMSDQEDMPQPTEEMEGPETDGGPATEEEPPRDSSPPPPPEPEVEREPPITFKDNLDAREEFECLVGACGSLLNPEEQAHLEELRAYVLDDEGSWALGENFSSLLGRVLHDGAIPDEARVHLVRVMAAAALKDDVILLLHQDRRDHTIMNYANRVESLGADQQEALALFFCNMFEHVSPSEWLLYISEWQDGNQATSNIRVTTKVAVNALLNTNPMCQEYGSAIMYNLGTKEVKTVVFDDVAPELAMAILQFFSSHPPEELLWRTMAALCRFTYSSTEVPALIKMIGPEPATFRGASERVDALVEEIDAKLSRVRQF